MAKQNIPKSSVVPHKTARPRGMKRADGPVERAISIKGPSPEIPSLSLHTGTLNAFTFALVRRMVLKQGKRADASYAFHEDGTREFFAPLKLCWDTPCLMVKDMKSRIWRIYIHPDFENNPASSEQYKDNISIALHSNLFYYLIGQIPGRFHDQMDKEIEIQLGYLSTEEKHEIMDAVGEKIQEFRQAEEEGGA